MVRVIAGQKRPHLGLCLGPNVPFKGQQGSRSCIPDPLEESGLFTRVMNGHPSPLESRRVSLRAHCVAYPGRVAPSGPGGRASVASEASARGPRRCRPPTRPVLKHGPRSLTRARVRGSHESRRGAMKVKAALAGGRGGIPRPLPVRRGRTTGPSRPPRRGGGA